MSAQYRIEKGVPMPTVPRPKGSVTPEMVRAESAARARETARAHRAKGFCAYGSAMCYERPAEGHTMCDAHLEAMRQYAKERGASRKERGLCHDCGKRPAFEGIAVCLPCRSKSRKGSLPRSVLRGIKEARKLEAQRERAERNARLHESLHLLDERRQEIIRLRFPIDGSVPKTLQVIADAMGITRERVRQLEESAMLKIESGIPIPNESRGCRSEVAMTLKAMSVGQSFLCSFNEKQSATHWAKRLGYMITSRQQPDGQYRVWLVTKDENQ